MTMQVNTYINASIYGRVQRVLVLAIHRGGAIDVECADGRCFRISGLGV